VTYLEHLTDARRAELLREIATILGFNPDNEPVTDEALIGAVKLDCDLACRYRGLMK
jgi:hypothetical protein